MKREAPARPCCHEREAYCSIGKFIEQHLQECEGKAATSRHVVVVAHGIFNSEFLGALLARRPTAVPLEWSYRGEPVTLSGLRYAVTD